AMLTRQILGRVRRRGQPDVRGRDPSTKLPDGSWCAPGMAPRWPFPGDAASSADGHDDDIVTHSEEPPMTPSPFDAMPVTRPEAIAVDTFLIPNLAPGPDGLLL